MAILKNRPLFTACLLYIVCTFCAYFSTPAIKAVLLTLSIIALLVCAVCLLVRKLPRKTVLCGIALSLCVLLAFAGSLLAFNASMQKYERIAERESCVLSATVTERQDSEIMTLYRVRVDSIDGKPQHFDASFVCDFTSYLQVGDKFEANVNPMTLAKSASPYYNTSYALASGLRMQFECTDEQQILAARTPESTLPLIALHELNQSLCHALTDVCGQQSGSLVCALLLGERGYMQSSLARDFERAGASHMLALSGMHVSILMGAVGWLLSKLRVHRKVRAVLLIIVAIGYLLLTGVSISATRAVVMVCVLQLSYLLAADNDTLTTLGLVGAGILLLDPYSVCDSGFILSFLATFGIVVLVPPLHEYLKARTEAISKPPYQKAKRSVLGIVSGLLETLLVGVIACFAIFVPCCFLIGSMSVFSPLTTLLLSPVIAALLVLGTVTLLLSPIPLLANFFATLIRLLYAVSTPFLEKLSRIDGALIPLTHTAVRIVAIILCSTALILLILPLKKRKWLLALPPVLLTAWLCIFFPINALLGTQSLNVAYTHPSSISEALVSAQGYRAFICDLSSGSGTAMRAAMHAAKELHTTEVGAVLLTDCRTQHASMLSDLFSDYKTDLLYLPRTTDADMLDAQARICETAALHGVRIEYYEYGQAVEWYNGVSLTVHRTDVSRSTQPVLLITLQKGDAQLCMLNATAEHTKLAAKTEQALSLADAVVCMERGPKPRLTFSLDRVRNAKVTFATRAIASYCNPDSLGGVNDMTVCPEIAYFTIATKQKK